ncbi:MAG: arginine deiminase [Mycoplasmoidaceae bacterium]|nr:MAG: arginine deiminase [Mycoplasmoidaceae bacterium]
MASKKPINVYSEIGQLKEVIVQRPGQELENFNVSEEAEFLMDGDLDAMTAAKEHDSFVSILKKNGVKVFYFQDLFANTWSKVTPSIKKTFLDTFIKEAKIKSSSDAKKVYCYLMKLKPSQFVRKLIEGVEPYDLDPNGPNDDKFFMKPLANIYFQRDNFSSIGNCISINKMKYEIRQRENLMSEFVFKYNQKFKGTKFVYSRNSKNTIEGGDIFPYTEDTLVVGISERTSLASVLELSKNLKSNKENFKKVVCINVPKIGRLMHLDTWLTMLDKNKFLYSPNAVKDFKFWEIDLTAKSIVAKETKEKDLSSIIEKIIGEQPILIPVAGNKSPNEVDRETKYDGTNYLVIKPGHVVGYKRNKYTNAALKKAGIKVYEFDGNELSLGEGNARCMSMPIYREPVNFSKKNKK